MAELLTVDDVSLFCDEEPAVLAALVEGVIARACTLVPGLGGTLTAIQTAAAKDILRAAVVRFVETQGGVVQQENTAGGFGRMLSVNSRKNILAPSDVAELKIVVNGVPDGTDDDKAFTFSSIDDLRYHDAACDRWWGSPCSCGYDLSGEILYGQDAQ